MWPQIWNPLATDGRTAHTLNFLDGAVWARCLKGLIKFSLKVFNESLGPYETPYFSHESFSQTSVDSERKYQPTLEQSGQMCQGRTPFSYWKVMNSRGIDISPCSWVVLSSSNFNGQFYYCTLLRWPLIFFVPSLPKHLTRSHTHKRSGHQSI